MSCHFQDKYFIYTILAAILHITNIEFQDDDLGFEGGVEILNEEELEWSE